MRKLRLIIVSLAAALIVLFTSCDKSKTESVLVVGICKEVNTEENELFKNVFDSDAIVNIVMADGKKLKAAMDRDELKGKKFPFAAEAGIYPNGFIFIK